MSERQSEIKSDSDVLLSAIRLNDRLVLKNRLVMAPMTRCMSDAELVPTQAMADYYARRANAGLIISEACIVRADGQGYPNTPGIYNQRQIDGWKKITDKVHKYGGKMFLQLWHVGRVSHPGYLNGNLPIAPSAVALDGIVSRTDGLRYPVPRALDKGEIPDLVEAFAQGAKNALEAGFDGIELHAANGYLIDQFLHWQSNRRRDDYGGSPENMSRFALDVVDAVSSIAGPKRLGIRLSPAGYVHMDYDPEDVDVFRYLLPELNQRELAYVHTGMFDDALKFDELGGNVTSFLRKHYTGALIACGGYTVTKAAKAIREDAADLIAIGRPFIANPDYIQKVRSGATLSEYDESMLATLV